MFIIFLKRVYGSSNILYPCSLLYFITEISGEHTCHIHWDQTNYNQGKFPISKTINSGTVRCAFLFVSTKHGQSGFFFAKILTMAINNFVAK